MTQETTELSKKIEAKKMEKMEKSLTDNRLSGYQIFSNVLIDLVGCIIIGLSLGVLSQNLFGTSSKLTVFLTILGGISGIWSVTKYLISLDKKGI